MKKIKILCDPLTAAMAGTWVFSMILGAFVTYYGLYIDKSVIYETSSEAILCSFIVWLVYGIILVTIIKCIPIWFASVELDEEGMCLNSVYKKSDKIPFSEIRSFQIAYYRHIYTNRVFVVMGRTGLAYDKLSAINQVRSSADCIKIKLTKRTYKKLCKILPDDQKTKLERAMNGDLSKVAFNINAFIKRKERKKKQSTKRKK